MPKERRFQLPDLPSLGDPFKAVADLVLTLDSFAGELDKLAGEVDRSLGAIPRLETARLKPIEVEPGLAEDMRKSLDRAKASAEEALNLARQGKLSDAAKVLTQAAEKVDCPGCDAMMYKAALKLKLAQYEQALKEDKWSSTLEEAERDLRDFTAKIPKLKQAIREKR